MGIDSNTFGKKIMIIGSAQYKDRIEQHCRQLKEDGYEVLMPAFDQMKELNAYDVCEYNRQLMEIANEVHLIWDKRSMGTIFDFGMAFAMRKPLKIIYLEEKTFEQVMFDYARLMAGSQSVKHEDKV